MDQKEFETLLDTIIGILNADVQASGKNHKYSDFEKLVRDTVRAVLADSGHEDALDEVVQGFPDIVCGRFGIEVKATQSDNWRCVANSVSEGKRAESVENIYVIFGKMGGQPEVKWADYGDSIIHVRTSHVPRFEIELDSDRSLFEQIGVSYEDFRGLPMHEKMQHIRGYARGRLKEGERLWWLEDNENADEQEHSFSLNVKIYMDLPQEEKRKLRAEAAILCPEIVGGSRQRKKYIDVALYLITYHGVLAPQARDLFSAGSVAGEERGGHYLSRALADIQPEMLEAAQYLEDALFEEYWGHIPDRAKVIDEWLQRADAIATDWEPSKTLFLDR